MATPRPLPLTLAAVLAAALALAHVLASPAPARAAGVLVVEGDHARWVDDRLAPSPRPLDVETRAGRASPSAASASTRRGRRAVARALRRAYRARRISRASFRRYSGAYRRARAVRRRLRGARGRQLGYVVATLERVAIKGRLTASRMPVLFTQLARNTAFWPARPFPGASGWVRFSPSQVLYKYFPGRGLELHPLGTFKRANLIHGACVRGEPGCSRTALARLLDEMRRFAARRGGSWIAWEYYFDFDGGAPPWMSGLAQASGIVAYARAGELLGRPTYLRIGSRALGAFETAPPVGVRTRGFLGGVHYLQYSFAPRLYIFNAFLGGLIGLHDYAKIANDDRARGLFRVAEPEARAEVPFSDVGDWSRYSYRGPESTGDYHELLREFVQGLCTRRIAGLYCDYAARYRRYQTEPPRVTFLAPELAVEDRLTRITFRLSKLSVVELTVLRGSRITRHRLATFRRGTGSFLWRPRSPGAYTVRLGAKELRTGLGLRGRDSASVEVEPAP